MRNIFITILTGSIIIFYSCRKYYDPEIDTGNEKIPVIQGIITDNPGPYSIDLSWASSYYENNDLPIINARVTVKDELGNTYQFHEQANGRYNSQYGEFTGIAGKTYTLWVELPDGMVYESYPETMHAQPFIDSVYAEVDEVEFFKKDYFGEIIPYTLQGLTVYMNISNISDKVNYYRFATEYLTQRFYPQPGMYAIQTKMVDEIPVTLPSLKNENKQVIRNHEICFLPYFYDPDLLDYDGYGWIVIPVVYAISDKAFDYYQAISKQLNADKRIFDPIPSQISGNIRCITDTAKLVYGFFEVASQVKNTTGFYWDHFLGEQIIKIELPDYTKTFDTGLWDIDKPEPWIDFIE